MTGVAALAMRDIGNAGEVDARTHEIEEIIDELALVTAARVGLVDERNWTIVVDGVRELGVDPSIVRQFTGIDALGSLDAARTDVDEALLGLGDPELPAAVDEIRNGTADLVARSNEFMILEETLGDRSEELSGTAIIETGAVAGGEQLIDALQHVVAGTRARQSVGDQLMNYISALFTDVDNPLHAASIRRLIEQRAIYDTNIEHLESADLTGAVGRAFEARNASESVAAFDRSMSSYLDSTLADEDVTLGLQQVVENAQEIADVLTNGTESAAIHADIVDAALAGAEFERRVLDTEADDATVRTIWALTLLVVLSVALTGLLARSIVRPLRRLADQTRRLRDDGSFEGGAVSGPREVREVGLALDEAAGHLRLVEQQARALAAGDLEHEVLTSSPTGSLGRSLGDAVQTLATTMSDRERLRRRLAHEASHDGLTSLPNRNASLAQLSRSLARTRRSGDSLAVFFIDLDGFKLINDHHGHLAGDALLKKLSERLVLTIREGDLAGRLGGDEFLVVAEPVDGVEEALIIARRLLEALEAPVAIGGEVVHPRASIGVSLAECGTDLTPDELLRDADLAVYKAKQGGTSSIELCDDELRRELVHVADLERSIRRAIDEDEFVLHYQPIYANGGREVTAFEALLRWNRPGHGMVPPLEFIPFAEKTDLIVEIDRWVLDHAIEQLAAWSVDGNTPPPVAVNVSGRHFASDSLIGNVLEPIERHGVDPELLVIEITESSLLADVNAAAERLTVLRGRGIKVAIDDFGTGYTSLAYLRALPVDILKIDRSFVSDASATSFVQLIIDAGHLIGASITAEGVETSDQVVELTRLGCDRLQGFYFARPAAPEDLGDIYRVAVVTPGVAVT